MVGIIKAPPPRCPYPNLQNLCIFYPMFSSVAQSCPTLCDPIDYSMPGFPVHDQLPELAQTHVHRVNPKENQPWIFIGRTDAEAEAPILGTPDAKSWLIAKDPGAGKDWGQEEKGATEDEMAGWHHLLIGQEFEQTLGDNEGQNAWHTTVHRVTKSQTQLSD